MGLVFVLLLGEIDLAAGTAAGVCAAVMGRVSVGYGAPWPVAIGAAMLTGVAIGVLTGVVCAKIRIPSFVVTLALFLGFQGVVLYVVNNGKGPRGNISITDNFINDLDNGQMKPALGWVLVAIVVVAYAAVKLTHARARSRAGLSSEPVTLVALKVAGLAVVAAVAVIFLNENRATNKGTQLVNQGGKLVQVKVGSLQGVPWVVPLILAFFVIWTFVLSRTRYGRHIYATGGNEEAARRAGIPVDRIRISVFVICSFMASIGGVLLASNVRAVAQNAGGGNTLLLAVGAAVIGGTSLFGGKGRPLDAVIGGLVIAVIANGMSDLVHGTNSSAVQFIVTGIVLLIAAAVDALARRRASAAGLA
jgi:D-xylose transport system permease protein